jgi:hypothetical protein
VNGSDLACVEGSGVLLESDAYGFDGSMMMMMCWFVKFFMGIVTVLWNFSIVTDVFGFVVDEFWFEKLLVASRLRKKSFGIVYFGF